MIKSKKTCWTFVAILLLMCAACSRDPHGTALPTDLADIPKIQPQLNKLPADERELVLAYLERSNGDVLLPSMADPDAPLTARTFAEAIKLQRQFNVKFAKETERVESFKAARDETFEPLRKALPIELLDRKSMSVEEAYSGQTPIGRHSSNPIVLVTSFRLRNNSGETITQASGTVQIRSTIAPQEYFPIIRCYLTRTTPLQAGESFEARCADVNDVQKVTIEEYAAMPADSLILLWEPQAITFADGRVLKSQ